MQKKLVQKQYTAVDISTADPERLLLMLYDGCMYFLKQAKAALEENDIQSFSRYLSKAQAIICEFMLTLNFDQGGELPRQLERLYEFMLFYLTEANIEKDPAKVAKVIEMLASVAEAYRMVIASEHTVVPPADGPTCTEA